MAALRPRDNSAYIMGPVTDAECEHTMVTVGAPNVLIRYALCFRVLDLWQAFAAVLPYAIVLPEERREAAAAAQREYVLKQRRQHLAQALARHEAHTRRERCLDETAQRAAMRRFRIHHQISAADLAALLEEVFELYEKRVTRSSHQRQRTR